MKKLLSIITAGIMTFSLMPQPLAAAVNTNFDISDTDTLYVNFDYSDPQWIDDETFFGKWNSDEEKWEKEPYFDYEKYYDGLGDAEEAVKQGDYEEAKDCVTAYYKNKFLNQPRSLTSANDNVTVLTAKLEAYNCFFLGSATPLDIVEFTGTQSDISADITSEVQAVTSDTKKIRTFEVASVRSGESMAVICSRETEHSPYAEVEVNGSKRRFPVIKDTYLRGGSYKNETYGKQNQMYVSENTDYSVTEQPPIYTDNPKDPDFSNTMRARMTVDFTGLVDGDQITSATLVMTGNTDDGESKECIVFSNMNGDGEETGNSWSWAKANRVYNSFDGIAGPLICKANYDQTQQQCYENYTALYKVFRDTGEEIYAYHAFRLYNNYIRAYGYKVPAHTKLEMGTKGTDMPVILAHLAPSEYFNSEFFIPILKYVWTLAQGLVDEWDSQAETSNWGLYETAGLANLATNFKEFRAAEAPMIEGGTYGNGNSGGWKEVMSHRYDILSGNLLREDRSFHETLGYGKESLNQYLKYATYSEEAGEPFEFGDMIKTNLADYGKYMMTATGPDFRDYQIGDSYGYVTSFRQTLKQLGDLTGDPNLIWAGSNGKDGTKPDYTSKVYPDNRKAMFKTGWGDNDLYMDFTSDQTVATHNHPDDLNLVMFAYGQYLLSDQKQFSYTVDAPERNWCYSTDAHNTLSVPGITHKANLSGIYSGHRPTPNGYIIYNRDQEASPGVIHRTELNDAYDYVEMSHANYENYIADGYVMANVNCKRAVMLMKNKRYVIVNDYVTALDSKDYNIRQNWHMLPDANIEMSEDGIARSNFVGANIQIVPVVTNDGMETKLVDGYYSPQNESLLETKYAVYEKGGSGDKTFCTVLLPTPSGSDIESYSESLKLDTKGTAADAFRFTMEDKKTGQTTETSYYRLHDDRYKSQRIFGSFSTDASLAVAEVTDGKYSQLILQDGKNLMDVSTKKTLIYSEEKIPELSVSYDNGIIDIDTSKDIDLEKLTLRSEKNVSEVRLNGEAVPFSYEKKYVYFGTQPLLADKEEEKQEDKGSSSSSDKHGSSSPSGGGSHSGGVSGGGTQTVRPSDKFKSELSGHWAENEIKQLVDRGIVRGKDGRLDLKAPVTRAEMLTLILRALGRETVSYGGEFADITENDWYAGTFSAAKALGICDGDGTYAMPDNTLTREQMAKFIVCAARILGSCGEVTEADYSDKDSISVWAAEYVNEAAVRGILSGMGDGSFNPQGTVLREQAFKAIANLCI